MVQGGSQPIAGATIQLYAVGTTGSGSASTPLLATPATTDSRGAFSITGQYSCPSASSLVYLVATGGNPGMAPGTNNPTLALMTVLGACGDLTPSTFIVTNELTTVAGVWALAPYMSSYSSISSSAGDPALANAFTLASQYVNTSTGAAPGVNVPAGATVPIQQLNTLADILTVCVNSTGGVAGDGSPCGSLLSAATPSGSIAPANAIAAALNMANNPSANTSALFGLVAATSPFQPALVTAPPSLSVSLILASTLSISPGSLTFPSTVLLINSSPQTVTLTNTGSSAIPIYAFAIAGVNSTDFTQVNDCTASLAPSASCTVQVTFTPSAAGTRSGYLSIETGSPNPMQYIGLTGTTTTNAGGQAGPVTILPAALTFTQVGSPQQVTLSNFGVTPLTIQGINLSTGYTQTNDCAGTLAAQSTCTFSITLNDASGGLTGALVLFDDATSGSQTVQLNIPVTNGSPSFGSTTTNPLFFGAEDIGVASGSQSYFGYSGSHSGTTVTGTITGTNASDFYFVGSNTCSSAPNGCSLSIAFKPTAAGYRTATLTTNYGSVALNGVGNPGGPAAFALSPPIVSITSGVSAVVTVTNLGGTTLNLSEAMGGLNPGDFGYWSGVSGSCGSTLAPGLACSLPVYIATTTVVGTRVATLTVADTTSGLSRSAYLTGTATYPPPTVPNSLNWFYNTQVGSESTPQTVTATAPDGHALNVQMVQGVDVFQITSPNYCPGGAPCSITAVFRPSSTACVQGSALVTDTTSGKTATLTLNGCGGVPALTLSSTALTFVARNVGSTSTPQTVTLTNSGNATLAMNDISVTGVNSGDFQISNTCPVPSGYLSVYQSCTISVTFTPSASGPRNAALVINSTSANSPQLIPLTGDGIASSGTPLTLSPSSLSFTLAGVPQTVTVTNSSFAPVTIGNISMSSMGSQTNNCPQVLDAQSICNISVQITALTYANAQSGNLTIISSASSPQDVRISVPIATAYFSAAPLNFGSWAVGFPSPYQIASAHVGSYYDPAPQLIPSVTGPNASDFPLQSPGGCFTNYQCVVEITFTPGGTGTRTATLVTSYGNIALSGTGLPVGPSFTIAGDAQAVTIGAQLGATATVSPVLLNNGSTTLNLGKVTITGANAGDYSITNVCGYLSTGGSCSSLNLVFTPSALGTRTATLTVTDSISGTSKSIPLTGMGYAPAASSPTLSPSSLSFGNVEVGSQSSPSTVSVTAFGGDPVTITNYFSTPSPFLLSTTSCSQTPCQFNVTFQPTSLGNQNGTFMVLDTITQNAALLGISGTGGAPIVSLSSASLTFAARNQGSISIPQTITLTNPGDASLTLTSISFAGANPGDFSIQSNTCGTALAAGANCSFGISFSPTASGQRTASLQIGSNAVSSPDTVQLTGTGN
jgi:hypothetical protein